ncbi:MAG: SDR family oxidoreductase [Pseudomonadota bacterium]|nr:SDR family oxidoreductase [Pseudomonadota bacterium]
MTWTVVTGGASGIGEAVTRRLRKAGYSVVIVDCSAPADNTDSNDIIFRQIDISDEAAVEALAAELEESGVRPEALITCAGVLQRPLPPDKLSWKEWDLVQNVHLRGTYACCKSFGSRMASRGGPGAIVTVSSVAGLQSSPLHSYGPAKAAIAHLTRSLAMEWGRQGVRVNCVAPGFTKTPALDRGMTRKVLSATAMEKFSALGRLVESDEVAAAIEFLISPASSGITGVVLPVDAGNLAAAPWRAYESGEPG